MLVLLLAAEAVYRMFIYGKNLPLFHQLAHQLPLSTKLVVYVLFLVLSGYVEINAKKSVARMRAGYVIVWVLGLFCGVAAFALLQSGDPDRDFSLLMPLLAIWFVLVGLLRLVRRRAERRRSSE